MGFGNFRHALYRYEGGFFVPTSEKNIPSTAINAAHLAIIVSLVVFLILLLAIVIPLMLRYRQMSADLSRKEENLRVAATAFQTHEVIRLPTRIRILFV